MSPPTLSAALTSALAPAVLVAFLFGVRDSLRTLRHNTYVHLSRYFWSYAAVPVVTLTALVVVPALLVGLLGYALGLPPPWIAGASAGMLVGCCLAVDARSWLTQFQQALAGARVDRRSQRRATLCALLPLIAAGALASAAAVFVAHLDLAAINVLASVVAVLDVLLLPAALSFLVRDFHSLFVVHRARASCSGSSQTSLDSSATNSRATSTSHERPSVILISIDTLRADRLGAYGSRRGLTPNLDALAASGVTCDTAIAQSSWTLPSVASFLTGLNPSGHGAGPAVNGFDLLARAPLRRRTWTLAQALQAAGYRTHAIVSNPYLAVQYGLDAGFDTYENVSVESEALLALRPTLIGHLLGPFLDKRLTDSGALVTRRALSLLDRLTFRPPRPLGEGGGEGAPQHPNTQHRAPYFVWLHYIDPHAPYGCAGHKSFRGDTLLSGIRADAAGLQDTFAAIARLRAGEIRLTEAEQQQLIALYDAGVAEVDQQIGKVVNRLRPPRPLGEGRGEGATGSPAGRLTGSPASDPLILLVSDHGEEFWEHGGVEHGHTFYDELIRVPLILAGAGLPAGARLPDLVRLIDLPPTILEILGLPIPDSLDGASLVPLLPLGSSSVRPPRPLGEGRGEGSADSRLTSTVHEPRFALSQSLLFAEDKIALRTETYKYIRWANGKEELYNLRADPTELRDLAGSADLGWARQLLAQHEGMAPQPDEPMELSLAETAVLHARLHALGYIA